MKMVFFFFVLLSLINGCTSSLITSSWKAEHVTPVKYNRILVIALLRDKDDELRNRMETHLKDDLSEKGFNAISSMKEFGPHSFEGIKEDEILRQLKNSNIDGVITIVLLNKEKEKYYVPGRVYYSPFTIYHRRFPRYYTIMYQRIYEPGYYSEQTNYFWESNFFNIQQDSLLYSVQTRSFNPQSAESLAHEYGKVIAEDFVQNNILKQ